MPQDDPVYRFMDKKRAEGKPYLVYMTAAPTSSAHLLWQSKRISGIFEGN